MTGTSKRIKADREGKAKVESLLQHKALKTIREHEPERRGEAMLRPCK